jgi:hypothetical protein
MKQMSVAMVLVISLAILLVVWARPVYSCSCIHRTTAERFSDADIVFRGRVVEEHEYSLHYATFEVYEVWKGTATPVRIIRTRTSHSSCGAKHLEGLEYLIFASSYDDSTKSYYSGSCGYTWLINNAENELNLLGAGSLLAHICPQVTESIPEAVRAAALEHPNQYWGWARLANPNIPESPFNTRRMWLSLINPSMPYSPSNYPIWKAACP